MKSLQHAGVHLWALWSSLDQIQEKWLFSKLQMLDLPQRGMQRLSPGTMSRHGIYYFNSRHLAVFVEHPLRENMAVKHGLWVKIKRYVYIKSIFIVDKNRCLLFPSQEFYDVRIGIFCTGNALLCYRNTFGERKFFTKKSMFAFEYMELEAENCFMFIMLQSTHLCVQHLFRYP